MDTSQQKLFWVKEARHKIMHHVRFHLNDVLEEAKLIYDERNNSIGSRGREWGALAERIHKGFFWSDGNILYLHGDVGCVGVSTCQNSSNYILKNHAFHNI